MMAKYNSRNALEQHIHVHVAGHVLVIKDMMHGANNIKQMTCPGASLCLPATANLRFPKILLHTPKPVL
jgi:hypothetical protein